MKLTVDSISKRTYISYNSGKRKRAQLHPDDPINERAPKLWYNRRTKTSLRKIKEYLFILSKYSEYENKKLYFITITTLQHQTGYSDKDIFVAIKKYTQHRKNPYCCVLERQRQTQDLHMHIIWASETSFNIANECKRLGILLNNHNTNVFNVQLVHDTSGILAYFFKYIAKPVPSWEKINQWAADNKLRSPYSSLFLCRTFSVGGGLGKLYKRYIEQFKFTTTKFSDIVKIPNNSVKFDGKYFTEYEYEPEQFHQLNPQSSITLDDANDGINEDFEGIDFDAID